jgi:uncharacterized membrane protein
MSDVLNTDRNSPEASSGKHEAFGDRQMDAIMGRLLQIGVLLASSVVLVGGILYLRLHHASAPNYSHFRRDAATLLRPSAMLHAIAQGNPAAIIQLGILLLIATPIARVIFAAVAFAIERDRLYLVISLIVLCVLLYGFFQAQ